VLPTRRARLETQILQELSLTIGSVKDPRVTPLTITSVKLTSDGSHATVYIVPFGGETEENEVKNCLEGLESAKGFLRKTLAKALNVRHVPELSFKEDRGLENTIRVHEILKDLKKESS